MNDDSYINELKERIKNIDDLRTLELINKLIKERNHLIKVANHDHLTDLNNRRILENIDCCSAVVMCDIDDLKQVNDSYGHLVGDKVIRNVAQIIKSCVRDTDYVCRYGGDEFLLAFVNCPAEIVKLRLEEIRCLINEHTISDKYDNITMSFGFVFPNNSESFDDLKQMADVALYESKRRGKNQITSYDEIKKSSYTKKKINPKRI